MKLSYFGYSVLSHTNKKKYQFNIGPFLRGFSDLNNSAFKSTFSYGGENIYLIQERRDLFLFLKTSHNEVVKKIESKTLAVSEIRDLLSRNEQLGFASYVYLKSSYLGFASTHQSPRPKALITMVDALFASVGLDQYRFVLHPMLLHTTKAEAVKMSFIGRTTLQINSANSLFEDFAATLGMDISDFEDIGSLEVVIKPKGRRNIADAAKKLLKNMPEDGVEKLTLRAREHFGDNLTDLYLEGKGLVSDPIDPKSSSGLYEDIKDRASKNPDLKDKVSDHESNDSFEKTEPSDIAGLHSANAWAIRLANL